MSSKTPWYLPPLPHGWGEAFTLTPTCIICVQILPWCSGSTLQNGSSSLLCTSLGLYNLSVTYRLCSSLIDRCLQGLGLGRGIRIKPPLRSKSPSPSPHTHIAWWVLPWQKFNSAYMHANQVSLQSAHWANFWNFITFLGPAYYIPIHCRPTHGSYILLASDMHGSRTGSRPKLMAAAITNLFHIYIQISLWTCYMKKSTTPETGSYHLWMAKMHQRALFPQGFQLGALQVVAASQPEGTAGTLYP